MLRTLGIMTLIACNSLVGALSVADDVKPRPTYDPVALFKPLDADKDGQLSLDEFLGLMETSAKLKDRPDVTKRLFAQLNTTKDYILSLDEFTKIVSIGQTQPPIPSPEPKKSEATEPDKPTTPQAFAQLHRRSLRRSHQRCLGSSRQSN